eukprot:5320238-Pleurochrysis_carterae.AAC.1
MLYSGATGTLALLYSTHSSLYSTHPRASSCDRSIGVMSLSQWRVTTAVSMRSRYSTLLTLFY